MLDIKWIRENSEKFDAAMIARNVKDAPTARYLILLDDLKKIDAQIEQEQNALKKIDARMHHMLSLASKSLDCE